jgi:hypothetical protein
MAVWSGATKKAGHRCPVAYFGAVRVPVSGKKRWALRDTDVSHKEPKMATLENTLRIKMWTLNLAVYMGIPVSLFISSSAITG